MTHGRLPLGWRIVSWLLLVCMSAWSVQAQALVDMAKGAGDKPDDLPRALEVDAETGQPIIAMLDASMFRGLELVGVARLYRQGLEAQGLGPGWLLSCDQRVVVQSDGSARLETAEETLRLNARPDGSWETLSGPLGVLKKTAEGYRLDLPGRIVRQFDKNGLLLQYAHPRGGYTVERGADGLAKAVVDRAGKRLVLASEQGRYVSLQDPLGSIWKYRYDDKGRLAEVTRPGGLREQYAYDDANRLASADQGFGKVALRYDARGRVTEQAPAAGGAFVERRTYTEAAGWLESRIEVRHGIAALHRLSADGRTAERTDATGTKTTTVRDSRRQVTAVRVDGKETFAATFDERGLCRTLAASGATVALTCSPAGEVTALKAGGRDWRQEFDGEGRQVRLTSSDGRRVEWRWNAAGQCMGATVRDKAGDQEVFAAAYDGQGNIARLTLGKRTIAFKSDAAGRITSIEADGKTFALLYDAEGRLTSVSEDGKPLASAQYDPRSLPAVLTGLNGLTAFEYARDGRLTGLTDCVGRHTAFQFDSLQRLTGLTNPAGQTYRLGYDARGRITSQSLNGVPLQSAVSDETGRILQFRKGAVPLNCQYDANGRLAAADAGPTHGAVKYTYAASGDMTGMTDSSGESLEVRGDVSVWRNAATTAEVTLEKKKTADGAVAQISVKGLDPIRRHYDARDRLVRIESPAGTFDFAYDAQGRRTELRYPNGIRAAYAYGNAGNLASITLTDKQGAVIEKRSLVPDARGRCSRVDLQDGSARLYAYDAAGRLVRVTDAGGAELERYRYDTAGHLAAIVIGNNEEPARYDEQGRLTSLGTRAFSYDAQGRRVAEKSAAGTAREYTYDGMDRLVGVKTEAASVRFGYSLAGTRLWREKTGEPLHAYLYAGPDVVAEADERGTILAAYVHGSDVDEILASRDASGTWLYHHRDQAQSLRLVTDGAGKKQAALEYSSFGIPAADSAAFPYLYAGRDWDPVLGHYYNRARYYDPATAEFLTLDPVGLAGGVLPYAYCAYDPVNFRDPEGTWVWMPVIGFAIGAGLELARQIVCGEDIDLVSIAISGTVGALEASGLGPVATVAVNVAASVIDDCQKMIRGTKDAPKSVEEVVVNAIVTGVVSGIAQGIEMKHGQKVDIPGNVPEKVGKKIVQNIIKGAVQETAKQGGKELAKPDPGQPSSTTTGPGANPSSSGAGSSDEAAVQHPHSFPPGSAGSPPPTGSSSGGPTTAGGATGNQPGSTTPGVGLPAPSTGGPSKSKGPIQLDPFR